MPKTEPTKEQISYDKAIAYLDSKGIDHTSQTDEHWLEALKIASGLK